MNESTLRKLAIACSFAGILLLFFASNQIQTATDINTITIDDTGKLFKVCGHVISTKTSNNHIFLDIEDSTGSIKFVIFNESALKLNKTGISPFTLTRGVEICAPGVVDEYPSGTGRLELVYRKGDIEVH